MNLQIINGCAGTDSGLPIAGTGPGLCYSFSVLFRVIFFCRQAKATMPRIFIYRALISLLVFVFTFSYWLFYVVRVLEDLEQVTL